MAYAAIIAAPWVPLGKKDVQRALRLAKVGPNDLVYDLGSGDGRIIIAAAKEFKAKSVGFEIAFLPYIISYVKIFLGGLAGKVQVRLKNFYKFNLGDASVVITFLLPKAMGKLDEKMKRELKPGTRIITCAWRIPGWTPDLIDKPEKCISMFLYTVK